MSTGSLDVDVPPWEDVNEQSEQFGLILLKNGAKIDLVEQPRIDDLDRAGGSTAPANSRLPADSPVFFHGSAEHGKYARFRPVAEAFAAMSRMPGTKVGCVILGGAGQVLASGWNGAPRRSKADVDGRLATRESRLTWVVHAEMNAIANAARSGTPLDGGTLLCTLMPCMTCAKSIVQAGIKRVMCPTPGDEVDRWGEEFKLARELFRECFVDLVYYDTLEKCE